MATEAEVVKAWESWCREQGGTIVQVVYPGGQAALSITYKNATGQRKTVFPDFIAVVSGRVLVGEAKPTFSKADAAKLSELTQSPDAIATIHKIVSRRNLVVPNLPPIFFLAHGSTTAVPINGIFQFVAIEGKCSLNRPADYLQLAGDDFATPK